MQSNSEKKSILLSSFLRNALTFPFDKKFLLQKYVGGTHTKNNVKQINEII